MGSLVHPAYPLSTSFRPCSVRSPQSACSPPCASPCPAHAAANDEAVPSPEALAQLELRASQANPREQCFLYTELVHSMTIKAGQELSDGETDQAAATLKQVNRYAHLIHLDLAQNTKRLKDAQVLMHRTTYRLAQYLHLVSGDDRRPSRTR